MLLFLSYAKSYKINITMITFNGEKQDCAKIHFLLYSQSVNIMLKLIYNDSK